MPRESTPCPQIAVFEREVARYEAWFEAHADLYRAELALLRDLLPADGPSLEVGCGTGRFAAPLGIPLGVEPARAMACLARQRGLLVVQALGERLPFPTGRFAAVLLVTVVCFVPDLDALFAEVRRVLRPNGVAVVGFVDRETPLGRYYLSQQAANPFYRVARFVSADEVIAVLRRAGFALSSARQTLFGPPPFSPAALALRPGYGEGGFVGLQARRLP